MGPVEARRELQQRGVPYSEEQFLRQIKSGNADLVGLFLQAGISPNAALDGDTAIATAAKAGHREIVGLLLKAGADPLGLLTTLASKAKAKDSWEKLASLSGIFTFLSSLLIATVGWYFTNAYNDRQLEWNKNQSAREQENKEYQNRLAEMQTVERMIPHLANNEASKRAALVAISILASPKLATRFAEVYGGQGSVDALSQIATSTSTSSNSNAPAVSALTNLAAQESRTDSGPARDALARVLQGKEKSIVQLQRKKDAFCNGFITDAQRGWIATPGYCLDATTSKASEISVQLSDGSLAMVSELQFTDNKLVAFLRIDAPSLRQLDLSTHSFRVGDTVTKLAFDLQPSKSTTHPLRVAVGRIAGVGRMEFVSNRPGEILGEGFTVTLPPEEARTRGSAGAPLLDGEGNVACMTYQGDQQSNEQCLAADEIRAALRSLRKT
jgi:S1-C subfamily serine protease